MRPDQKKSGWLDDDLGDRHHSIIAWTQCCFTKRGSFRASRFCSIYYRKGSSSVYFVTRTCTYLSISIYISWYDTHIYIYSYLCIKPIWNCIASTPHKLMAGTLQNDGIFDDFRLHKIGVPCWIFGACPESNNYSTWKLDGWADEEICSLLGGDGTKPPIFRSAELPISFQGMENEHFISYFFLTVVFDSVWKNQRIKHHQKSHRKPWGPTDHCPRCRRDQKMAFWYFERQRFDWRYTHLFPRNHENPHDYGRVKFQQVSQQLKVGFWNRSQVSNLM